MQKTRHQLNKEYYQKNKEKEKERCLAYYHANKEKIDREKKRLYMKEYLKTYKRKPVTPEKREEINRKRRDRYAADKEYRMRERAHARNWAKKNPEKKLAQRFKENGFNITLKEYRALLKKQNGRCAICGTDKLAKTKNRLSIDHCHKTGTVRGLLCHHCNFGLGHFQDNPELLMKAIRYLGNSSCGATSTPSKKP